MTTRTTLRPDLQLIAAAVTWAVARALRVARV